MALTWPLLYTLMCHKSYPSIEVSVIAHERTNGRGKGWCFLQQVNSDMGQMNYVEDAL